MRTPTVGTLRAALLLVLSSSPAWATPPRAPTLAFELHGAETPHSLGGQVRFPLTVRALQAVPAGSLRVLLPPGDRAGTLVPYPDLGPGDVRTLSVSLPVTRVGTYAVLGVAPLAQLDATVLVRPDRVQALMSRDYEAQRHQLLRADLNNPRRQRRNAPLDGIEIAIAAEKSRYVRAEPITFDISITNSGSAPRTLVDADLGFREMAVFLDGPTVGNQGHGKSVPLTDPFPDGILRLAPGAHWKGRVTFDNPKDLDEIAGWPGHSFGYRFLFGSFALPFFASGPALANLWQGSLTAESDPRQPVIVEGTGVVIPWVPKSMRDAGGTDDASVDAARADAATVQPDAGHDAATAPASSHTGLGCALSTGRSDRSGRAAGFALVALVWARRRRRSAA